MTKKILLGLFTLLMIAVSMIAYNFYKNVKHPIAENSIIAVPQDAAVIIQERNFNALYNKISSSNFIWKELIQNTSLAKDIHLKMSFLDSLFQLQSMVGILQQKSILSSIHLSGANSYNFIFYLPISPKITENEIIKKLQTISPTNLESRVYDNVTIYSVNKISFIYYQNIFAFSYNNVLIEDVIRQLNSTSSLLNNQDFLKVYNTLGESIDGNLLINNSHFSKIISQYLDKVPKEHLNYFENYADWTELDMNLKSNAIMLNGFTYSSDSNNNFLNLFKHQIPQSIDILSVLPSNTALLYYYGLDNSKQFFKDRRLLLKSRNMHFNYQKFLEQHTTTYSIDLEEEFLSNIDNELAFLITEPSSKNYKSNQFVVFKSKNIEQTEKNLLHLSNNLNKTEHQTSNFKSYSIHKIDLPEEIFAQLIGSPFPKNKYPFYTIINDYVAFGNSELALKTYLKNYSIDKTLIKNKDFQSFNDHLSSKTNIFVYNNIARSVNIYQKNLKESYKKILEEKDAIFKKFEAIAFQINSDKNNFYYNNIYLKYNPVYKESIQTLWETPLDTTVSSKPYIVTNHKTNLKEVFVQDDANKIYLIGSNGKVLWNKQLSQKIEGKVHQVDAYKNNKLQLLFNTKQKIYLLDRNGKNVGSFPIELKSEAATNVTPLDYSKNKNYRILIGCNNSFVYNYDINGNLVDGWQYNKTNSPAKHKIWHFTISSKDYIVVPLKDGQIKIIQRNGKDRLTLNHKLPVTQNPSFLVKGEKLSSTYITTADSLGNITKLYFDDRLEKLTSDSSKNEHFNTLDINSDGFFDFIFTNKNYLSVFDNKQNLIFKTTFNQNISQPPLIFKLKKHESKIGTVVGNEIYLIDNFGNIEADYPLTGSTLFSINSFNNDSTLNLVVADKNMVYTYRLK